MGVIPKGNLSLNLDAEVMERIAEITGTNYDDTIKQLRNRGVPTTDQIILGMVPGFVTTEELSFDEQDVLGEDVVQELLSTMKTQSPGMHSIRVARVIEFIVNNFQPELIVFTVKQLIDEGVINMKYDYNHLWWESLVEKFPMFFDEKGIKR